MLWPRLIEHLDLAPCSFYRANLDSEPIFDCSIMLATFSSPRSRSYLRLSTIWLSFLFLNCAASLRTLFFKITE